MRRATLMASVILATAGGPASAYGGGGDHGAGHGGGGGPAAAPGTQSVKIVNRAYSPARLNVLVGESVAWRNEDYVVHNVSLADGAIFSGPMNRGGRFSHRFAEAGAYPFLCTLHPFMTGQVGVHAALLEAAAATVLTGHEVELHGRAPAGSQLTIEQRPSGASAFTAVTSVQAGADGGFHAKVRPQSTTAYRAVSAAGASPAVTVTLASRLDVRLVVRESRRFTRVRVSAAGAGGARATLQLYSRERFSWKDRRRARLDAAGRASFRLPAGLRKRARVVITSADGVELGMSRSVRLSR